MNVHLNWMSHEVMVKRTNWFLSRLSQGFLSHHMGKQSLPLRDESLHLWKTPDLGLLLERYRYTSPCSGPASHSKNPTSAPAKHNACLFHLQGLSRTGFKTGYSKNLYTPQCHTHDSYLRFISMFIADGCKDCALRNQKRQNLSFL